MQRSTESSSRIPLKAHYDSTDGARVDAPGPGEYPFTRGIHAEMYRRRLWTMRQYAGIGTPQESNERFRYLLGQGQTGLSVAFDLPTQLGMDSDDERARGEVGKVGVAIDTLADMELAFQDIPLDQVTTSMTINAPASVLLAMYIAVGERQGVRPGALAGTVQNDVLKEYVARGTYVFPPRPSLRLAGDVIAYCARHVPRWNPISVSGYHIRDAGSTAVQEMAYALSNAVAYVEEVVRQGCSIDEFAPRISWIFNTHNHFFEEIAKYRALRRMWATLMRERFGAEDRRSWLLRTHTQTGGVTLTAQQPENNIVRAAIQALAAVLGGVQSMALSCKDEALAIPTPESQQTALRTQQIIAQETGVTDVVDPLGGSHYVEWMTDELERRARELMDEIDALGGAVAAIEQGVMQRAIAREAYEDQKRVESGERTVVGVNAYESDDEGPRQMPIFRPDPRVESEQIERLDRVRSERDGAATRRSLERLADCARGDDPLMPAILEAVRTYATVGEIMGAMGAVFGYHRGSTEY